MLEGAVLDARVVDAGVVVEAGVDELDASSAAALTRVLDAAVLLPPAA